MSAFEYLSPTLRAANGQIWFECPGCGSPHAVRVGEIHSDRWTWNGNVNKPTFSPSVLVTWPEWDPPVTSENLAQWDKAPWPQRQLEKRCHSFVVDGVVQFLDDCTHKLAGQSAPIPAWDPEDRR